MNKRTLLIRIVSICMLLESSLSTLADETVDLAGLEEYADDIIVPAMAASGVPGAILSVVTSDGIVLAKGYGVSDLESRTPVDAKTTLFNIASIGKTFTGILALQLVERGLLDLDEDVNNYLSAAQVSGGAVTMRNLLGHQAGFDPDISFLFVDLGEDDSMTEGEISRRLRLLRTPGKVARYDNAAYGVAGMVLSEVANKSYAQLLQDQIFTPLGMDSAEYVEAGTDPTDLARCYVPLGPGHIADCEYYPVYRESIRGAGGEAISAESMAQYMIALLNHGQMGDVAFLSPESFDELVDFDNVRFHPGLPGFSRPFTQLSARSKPGYVHGGSVPGFSSIMRIFDDADIGIFFSYMGGQGPSFNAVPSRLIPHLLENRPESPAAAEGLQALQLFTDHLVEDFVTEIPEADRQPEQFADLPATDVYDMSHYGGNYATPLVSESLGLRIMRHASPLSVVPIDDSSFLFNGSGPFHKIAPELYASDQGLRIAFSHSDGETFMAVNGSLGTFVKVPWYQSASWSTPLFLISAISLLTAAIYLPPRFTRKRRQIALTAVTGVTLTLAMLLAELEYAVWFVTVQGEFLLPIVWRLVLHGALLLLLAVPAMFLVYRRELQIHRVAGKLHAGLLSAAAISMVFSVGLWGVIGKIV